jgi:hypothetical protein
VSRILFVMLHPGFVRYFDGALTALADAGHQVHVAFEISRTKLGEDVTAQRLATRSPHLTCGTTPERAESVRQFLARGDRAATRSGDFSRTTSGHTASEEAWESLATSIRLLLDYLRFFEPAFAGAGALRARAEKRLPRLLAATAATAGRAGGPTRRAFAATLRFVERLIPVNRELTAFVRGQNPDVLLVTPLIELGSQQVDYVKCAREQGIPSALCVASWDNLTSKGLIRVTPDRVVVWNDAQRVEAVTLQQVPEERVAVTGAPVFDRWFDARPSRTREQFCRMVGLDPGRPFVLYVGSSTFIAPDEVPFVERLLWRLRTADEAAIAGVGMLIRPHPANARQWHAFDTGNSTNVGLWPAIGTDPNAPDFWRDYLDSLYYSAAVVGINTSAQIEAAIVGRPVLTIQTREFAHAQEGTLHFRYLVGDGGVVRSAASLDEHVTQLAQLLDAAAAASSVEHGSREFVRAFVRPHGLDVPASAVFADAVGGIAGQPRPAPVPASLTVRVLRPVALIGAFVARALAEDRPLWAHAARLPIAGAVRVAALGYRLRDGGRDARLIGKRMRRAIWRGVYESTQQLRAASRRVSKRMTRRVTRTARQVGGAAQRARRRDW